MKLLILHLFHLLTWLWAGTEKAMAPHSSTLTWKISWIEEPGRLQSMGSRRVGHDRATSLSLFTFMHWRRKWQPTPVFSPGKYHGQTEPVGYGPQGCQRARHDLETKQQQFFPSPHANIYFSEISTSFTWHFIQIHVCVHWGKQVGVALFNFTGTRIILISFTKAFLPISPNVQCLVCRTTNI